MEINLALLFKTSNLIPILSLAKQMHKDDFLHDYFLYISVISSL